VPPGALRLQIKTLLSRARNRTTGELPLAIDLRLPHTRGLHVLGNPRRDAKLGLYLTQATTQLLIVPTEPPGTATEFQVVLEWHAGGTVDLPDRLDVDINGGTAVASTRPESPRGKELISLTVPASAFAELSAYLVTFRLIGGARGSGEIGDVEDSAPAVAILMMLLRAQDEQRVGP
jgi:hypothetical protein